MRITLQDHEVGSMRIEVEVGLDVQNVDDDSLPPFGIHGLYSELGDYRVGLFAAGNRSFLYLNGLGYDVQDRPVNASFHQEGEQRRLELRIGEIEVPIRYVNSRTPVSTLWYSECEEDADFGIWLTNMLSSEERLAIARGATPHKKTRIERPKDSGGPMSERTRKSRWWADAIVALLLVAIIGGLAWRWRPLGAAERKLLGHWTVLSPSGERTSVKFDLTPDRRFLCSGRVPGPSEPIGRDLQGTWRLEEDALILVAETLGEIPQPHEQPRYPIRFVDPDRLELLPSAVDEAGATSSYWLRDPR